MNDPFSSLDTVALAPVLLVASDYDGTLAPIVSDPRRAFPRRETMVALKRLAAMSNTHVALISGRALQDLATLTGSPQAIRLVGSHGSEFDLDFSQRLDPEAAKLLAEVRQELVAIAHRDSGAALEDKPASIAFHFRNVADTELGQEMAEAVLAGPAKRGGVYTRRGKMVVELTVVPTDKGAALDTIRGEIGASAVIYLGDDITDEDAFTTLRGPDVAIKIGNGDSAATARLEDPNEVSRYLAALAEKRGAWLAGSHSVPIEKHSLLSDQRSVALVTDSGRVSWLCAPRIDSPAIFADLLGGPTAGYFDISPAAAPDTTPEQEYEPSSMSLRTVWPDYTVTDYLDCSGGRPGQRAGRSDLVRQVEGSGTIRIEFAPRMDFGRSHTQLRKIRNGIEVEDSMDPLVLRSPGVDWEILDEGGHQTARATHELTDRGLTLELRYGTRSTDPLRISQTDRHEQTKRHWQRWSAELRLPTEHRDQVERSALILKSLCYAPTGAIAAAATTSLPECPGGIRNWDYRYTWLRDAAMTASALAALGSLTEGLGYVDWLLALLDRGAGRDFLRPVYGVDGHELGIEAELGELGGYLGSRPVRVGNSAARQLQLDVYGPLLQLMLDLSQGGAALSAEHWRFVTTAVNAVAEHWREPDHGIWEVRGPKRHWVHSKVMCWVTIDRAVEIGQTLHVPERSEWRRLQRDIANDILNNGWKESIHAFSAAYDGTDLDAATLLTGLTGMLEARDPKFIATVEAVEAYLRDGVAVYRYRYDDGLPGAEGGFMLCTSWLIDAYIMIGRTDDARELFEQLCKLAGPTGLMGEEYDPQRNLVLGNVPQAYTHIGLIQNALNLFKGTAKK